MKYKLTDPTTNRKLRSLLVYISTCKSGYWPSPASGKITLARAMQNFGWLEARPFSYLATKHTKYRYFITDAGKLVLRLGILDG